MSCFLRDSLSLISEAFDKKSNPRFSLSLVVMFERRASTVVVLDNDCSKADSYLPSTTTLPSASTRLAWVWSAGLNASWSSVPEAARLTIELSRSSKEGLPSPAAEEEGGIIGASV